MDIEQLKLIISAITGLAGETKTVLIWYFVVTFVSKFIGWGLVAWVVVYVVKKITSLIYKGISSSVGDSLSARNEVRLSIYRAWLYGGENDKDGITHEEYTKANALFKFSNVDPGELSEDE